MTCRLPVLLVSGLLAIVRGADAAAPFPAEQRTVDLSFRKEYVPEGLKAGERVALKILISSKVNAKGEIEVKTSDFLREVEVAGVVVEEKPTSRQPPIRVTFRLTQAQADQLAEFQKNVKTGGMSIPWKLERVAPAKK